MMYRYNDAVRAEVLQVIKDKLLAAPSLFLKVFGVAGEELVSAPFSGQAIKTETPLELVLFPPAPSLLLVEGVATTAALFIGATMFVTFEVGSSTTRPEAPLILNSLMLYQGGTLVIMGLTLKA